MLRSNRKDCNYCRISPIFATPTKYTISRPAAKLAAESSQFPLQMTLRPAPFLQSRLKDPSGFRTRGCTETHVGDRAQPLMRPRNSGSMALSPFPWTLREESIKIAGLTIITVLCKRRMYTMLIYFCSTTIHLRAKYPVIRNTTLNKARILMSKTRFDRQIRKWLG